MQHNFLGYHLKVDKLKLSRNQLKILKKGYDFKILNHQSIFCKMLMFQNYIKLILKEYLLLNFEF